MASPNPKRDSKTLQLHGSGEKCDARQAKLPSVSTNARQLIRRQREA
jgi:hypothetical protein